MPQYKPKSKGGENENMAERGSFYQTTLKIAAGLGTLAALSGNASAERKPDVIDCKAGTYRNTLTLNIPDGETEKISSFPNSVAITSLRDGGVRADSSIDFSTNPSVFIGRIQSKQGEVGIYVPGDTAAIRGLGKNHEITNEGRLPDNTGTVVKVTGECPINEPKK